MRITTIGKHGRSHQTTIPPEILHALGAHAGDYLAWTWKTNGHAELRRVLRAGELPTVATRRK